MDGRNIRRQQRSIKLKIDFKTKRRIFRSAARSQLRSCVSPEFGVVLSYSIEWVHPVSPAFHGMKTSAVTPLPEPAFLSRSIQETSTGARNRYRSSPRREIKREFPSDAPMRRF
jgi:hypothetical protein